MPAAWAIYEVKTLFYMRPIPAERIKNCDLLVNLGYHGLLWNGRLLGTAGVKSPAIAGLSGDRNPLARVTVLRRSATDARNEPPELPDRSSKNAPLRLILVPYDYYSVRHENE